MIGLMDTFGIDPQDPSAYGVVNPQVGQPLQQPGAQPPGLLGRLGNFAGDVFGGARDYLQDNPTLMPRMAAAFNTMRLNPDPAISQMANQQVARAQQLKMMKGQANKTADFLEAQGLKEEAGLIRANPMMSRDLLSAYFQNKYRERQTKVPISGAELNKMMPGANFDPDQMYNYSPTGGVTGIGSGGTDITVNTGDDEWAKQRARSQADMFSGYTEAGEQAYQLLPQLSLLEQLNNTGFSGPMAGRIANAFPGVNNEADAFNALRTSLFPLLRTPGSGSTSDMEFEAIRSQLGSVVYDRDVNAILLRAARNKAEINREVSVIANQVMAGQLDRDTGMRQIQEIKQRSIIDPEGLRLVEVMGMDPPEEIPREMRSRWNSMSAQQRLAFIQAGES